LGLTAPWSTGDRQKIRGKRKGKARDLQQLGFGKIVLMDKRSSNFFR